MSSAQVHRSQFCDLLNSDWGKSSFLKDRISILCCSVSCHFCFLTSTMSIKMSLGPPHLYPPSLAHRPQRQLLRWDNWTNFSSSLSVNVNATRENMFGFSDTFLAWCSILMYLPGLLLDSLPAWIKRIPSPLSFPYRASYCQSNDQHHQQPHSVFSCLRNGWSDSAPYLLFPQKTQGRSECLPPGIVYRGREKYPPVNSGADILKEASTYSQGCCCCS